ncbi:MAG: penicillin acylase family protein [SAR202 cluster bacterium]|nr:penicillin acylase family protein [SAR202 cluster bacterium]
MKLPNKEILSRLGAGEPIDSVRASAEFTQNEFETWWDDQIKTRVPPSMGNKTAPTTQKVEIVRDDWGVPHIFASTDSDLFFGYGYSMAQDRLWQLDYFRRKAMGRLAEVLGSDGLKHDITARTVGINRIAHRQLEYMASPTRALLDNFSQGINAVITESSSNLPIEFDLLTYEPEPWTPLDTIAIWCEFQWYLTGRLPVIAIPELAKRTLCNDELYNAFLTGEADEESIVPEGSYPPATSGPVSLGRSIGDLQEGAGSNNWVISGQKSTSGAPMVASDPHIAFGATSFWYETHLSGGSFNVTGAGYIGVPGIIFGRNDRVAWGVTNNICAQRDLYLEKTDASHPNAFLFNSTWHPIKTVTEHIQIKGENTVTKTVQFSSNGPVVNDLLPKECRNDEPVSFKWTGATESDEITSLLAQNRASNCNEFRNALRDWVTPTWSLVFADQDGHTGYQCTGRIPVKKEWDRAYRLGWDPTHTWNGVIPFDDMPSLSDPREGWIRSANNRTAPDDFPYPLSGVWNSGYRALRIRQMLQSTEKHSREGFAQMQTDVLSMRAVESVPHLVSILSRSNDQRIVEALSHIKAWDHQMTPNQVGASIFEFFFDHWSAAVASQRFEASVVPLIAGAISGLAVSLLSENSSNWFDNTEDLQNTVLESLNTALDELEERLGENMSSWHWGALHKIQLDHYLSGRGDLGSLLNRNGGPVGGNGITVCNTGHDPNYLASIGATYRLVADLGESPSALWAVDAAGQSGHPGSKHYCDQVSEWTAGRHHRIPLKRSDLNAATTFTLIPD